MLYKLSKTDLEIIQSAIRTINTLPKNIRTLVEDTVDSPRMDINASPETYIALTPAAGLPRAEQVGTADGPPTDVTGTECRIYRINDQDGYIEEVKNEDNRVYNISSDDIPGDIWVLIHRDKFGFWIAQPMPSDSESTPGDTVGAGSCRLARLSADDCVRVRTFSTDTGVVYYYLTYDQFDGHWKNATSMFVYPGGSGAFEFYYEAGRLHLLLGGMELLDCGDGCFTGSWLTGHGGTETGTGTPQSTACNATAFTVCVECSCCPIAGWAGAGIYCIREAGATGTSSSECETAVLGEDDKCRSDLVICSGPYSSLAEADAACTGGAGTGTGTGTGGSEGVSTTCCPDNLIPTTLYAHFSGALSALGTVTLTYDSGISAWAGDGGGVCSIGTIRFECSATNWNLSLGPAASTPTGEEDTCLPFYWQKSGTGFVCFGAFTVSVSTVP